MADYEKELSLVLSDVDDPSDLFEFLNGAELDTTDGDSPAIRIEKILHESGQIVELNEVIICGVRRWL